MATLHEVVMSGGAHTPEELETLFEDTIVLRDDQALAALFEDGAVLVAGDGRAAHGGAAIARLALARWSGEQIYVADPQGIVQAHDLALIIAERGINVAHRARDGTWRYAIIFARCDAASDDTPDIVDQDKGESIMSHTAEAYIYQAGEGEMRWMGETSTFFLATGPLTGGAFALVEERAIRGETVPLHKHDEDGESFYVLDGDISFYLGGQPGQRATAGAFVHIPQGTIHGFRIESEAARYLILTTPRHAEFYRAISLPLPHAVISDAVIEQACREYGVEFVGPLPA